MTHSSTARAAIAEVLERCSSVLGKQLPFATPDAVASVVGQLEWEKCTGWEQCRDAEIAKRSGLLQIGFDGPLLVVTEAALTQGTGAFVVSATEGLAKFVEQHLARFGECFFNGDVLIVDRAGTRVWLFHHEGLFTTITSS
jgi:hypothetical protein